MVGVDQSPSAQGVPEVLAYIGLGANLGDTRGAIVAAMAQCAALPRSRLTGQSAIYRTAPIDSSGDDYMNAVVAIHTALEPLALLRALNDIEAEHGRQRPYQNAPRTLDLDLLLYGDQIIATPRLTVPHPRMHERAFVLRPLADLAPDLLIPGRGNVSALLGTVADQRIDKLGE